MELPSQSKKYVSAYSTSFCLLLYYIYIFYLFIYAYVYIYILYDCTYISITTVIVVCDQVIMNFANTLILLSISICGIYFLHCVQKFCRHALLPTILPLFLLPNPFLKAEFSINSYLNTAAKAVEEEITNLTYKCNTKATQVEPPGQ